MTKPITYLDDSATAMNLEPNASPQLLFGAWLNHNPGHDEKLSFFVGPNSKDTHDALWVASDMADEPSAMAWLPRGILSGKNLYRALLLTFSQREKEELDSDNPNFTEVLNNPRAAFATKEINELAEQVWASST